MHRPQETRRDASASPVQERPASEVHALTGRIDSGPHELLRSEVLEPQLDFDVANLLPCYVWLEKVLLLEYRRMRLVDDQQVGAIARLLDQATAQQLRDDARASMTDIAFALERYVTGRLGHTPPAWHVDRSRNDLQASAHMLFGRARILEVVEELLSWGRAAHRLAGGAAELVMPGYTHLQPAQVISPGFYLSAMSAQALRTLERLDAVYQSASSSPMGAGAMAGQELPWDRDRMARLLGCEGVQRHALRAVATRDWTLEAAAELSLLGVALSRFATDLMAWGSASHGFIDLPDEWCGISSAMPQKRNFPVLERIRARTGHLTAGYLAVALGQRNTPYSNTVEVSKEASAQVPGLFDAAVSTLRLFSAVLDNLRLQPDRMRAACESEHLGGLTLANLLTLRQGVPWRTSQVIAGRYVVAAAQQGLTPGRPDPALLERLAGEQAHPLSDAAALLEEALDTRRALAAKRTGGSTHPDAVRRLLAEQRAEFDRLERRWTQYRRRISDARAAVDRLLLRLVTGTRSR